MVHRYRIHNSIGASLSRVALGMRRKLGIPSTTPAGHAVVGLRAKGFPNIKAETPRPDLKQGQILDPGLSKPDKTSLWRFMEETTARMQALKTPHTAATGGDPGRATHRRAASPTAASSEGRDVRGQSSLIYSGVRTYCRKTKAAAEASITRPSN